MKKHLVPLLLACVMMMAILPFATLAAEPEPVDVIYYEDGSYMGIYFEEFGTRASDSKSGSKKYVHYGTDGYEDWRATLYGSFTYYNGVATCTSASCNVAITDSAWSLVSKYTEKYDNVAQANVTMEKNGTNLYRTLYLSCDADGNLS